MARRPSIVKSVSLHVHIPEDIYLKMALHLHSEAEGRVPLGSFQKFISQLINDYFQEKPNVAP